MTVSTVVNPHRQPDQGTPPLVHGERLTQPEFHRRCEAMPPEVRAELVGGIVYILSSPVSVTHGKPQMQCANWLIPFEATSRALESLDNTTVILGNTGELQPDLCLRILESYGGSSRVNEKRYIAGLWLDAAALPRGDTAAVNATVAAGIVSPEHRARIDRLQPSS